VDAKVWPEAKQDPQMAKNRPTSRSDERSRMGTNKLPGKNLEWFSESDLVRLPCYLSLRPPLSLDAEFQRDLGASRKKRWRTVRTTVTALPFAGQKTRGNAEGRTYLGHLRNDRESKTVVRYSTPTPAPVAMFQRWNELDAAVAPQA
jgi:hypothetical protein